MKGNKLKLEESRAYPAVLMVGQGGADVDAYGSLVVCKFKMNFLVVGLRVTVELKGWQLIRSDGNWNMLKKNMHGQTET